MTACFDHRYEPGAYGVCRRCGEERPKPSRLGDILGAALRGEITPDEAQALATPHPETPEDSRSPDKKEG